MARTYPRMVRIMLMQSSLLQPVTVKTPNGGTGRMRIPLVSFSTCFTCDNLSELEKDGFILK